MIFSNKEIIDGLRIHNKDVVNYVYKENFKRVFIFITKYYGTKRDAEDIFHDAFISLFNILTEKKFKLSCAFTTFFIAICKNLWFNEIRRRSHTKANTAFNDYLESSCDKSLQWECTDFDEYDINEIIIQCEKDNLFRFHFERMEEICKRVLLLYFGKTPMKEIAAATGFKSEHTVKVRKHYCQEELIKNIKNDPEYNKIIGRINVVKTE
ncbi:MAG: sigma-70 family RNA polymerase sigma factor [Bacteroidia bacterium]|nr:sigma-70 family RNA polymerase sigma factor [Bacteroidia bacterium]